MKARIFWIFSLAVVLNLNCSKDEGSSDKIAAISQEGKVYLSQGEFQSSKAKFEEILNIDPENCDGLYGMLLSELMIYIDQITSALGSTGGLLPQSNEIDTIAGSMLTTVLTDFQSIESWVSKVEAKSCSFTLENLPMKFLNLEIRGEWDVHEAHLIGIILDAVEGVLEFLLGYDLSVNVSTVTSALSNGSLKLDLKDIVGTLRGLGFIVESSPSFLTWHPDVKRREFFDKSAGDFSSLFKRVNGLLDLFTEQDENPQDDIIAWVDGDGDGTVSSGDSLIINAYSLETGEPLVDLSQYSAIILPLVGSLLNDWKMKLTKLEDAFAFRLPQGERVSLNDMLLGFGNILSIPNIIEIDVLAFYKGSDYSGVTVKPLREILPYLYDNDANPETPSVWLVEGETYSSPPPQTETYLFQGDSEHFAIGFDWNPGDSSTDDTGKIKKDCTLPSEKGIKVGEDDNGAPIYLPLLYLGFQDPSFNGALYVDSGGSCLDPGGFNVANVYSANKAINRLLNALSVLLASGVSGLPF